MPHAVALTIRITYVALTIRVTYDVRTPYHRNAVISTRYTIYVGLTKARPNDEAQDDIRMHLVT